MAEQTNPQQMPATRRGLVHPVPAGRSGRHPTRNEARGPHWRRSSHGLYVPSHVDGSRVEQRIVEAGAVVPPGCAITGWAALRWLGGRWFGGSTASGEPRPVTIVTGTHDIRAQRGIAVSAEGLNPKVVITIDGVPVTLPAYAVSFEMRYASTDREATTVLDLAAYSDLVSIDEQWNFLATQNGWTGVPRARRASLFASENCWSPQEGWMRSLWEECGFPRPLCNVPVFDFNGRHLGTPDLIDPRTGVLGEYDGRHHLEGHQRASDLGRESLFIDHGLEVVTMLAGSHEHHNRFLERLGRAYARAESRSWRERLWTLEAPVWWTRTDTVEARRALTPAQRQHLLRYREWPADGGAA